MKKLRFYILAIITVFTLSCFASINKVYADEIQDVSFTYTEADTSSHYLCGGGTGVSCSGYQYISVNFVGSDTDTTQRSLRYTIGTEIGFMTGVGLTPSSVYTLPSSFNDLSVTWFGSGAFFSSFPKATVTVTLSASKGCPTCPTCPEPLDPNRSSVMQDFHDIFMNTMVSVIAICPIVFVIWFFIDMLSSLVFGRGK